jgi:hypothetical protein
MTQLLSLLPALGPFGRQMDLATPCPGLGLAMRPLTCSFYLQDLVREQDPTVPAPSDGQEGGGAPGSGFICTF